MSQIDDFLNDGPQPQGGSQTARKPDAVAKPKSQVDAFLADAPAPDRGLGGFARDAAAWAVKGAIAVPEAIVGLADIPTGGRVGKALENEGGTFGFRPKQAREIVNEWHSDATKEAQRKFQEAEGLGGKFQAAIENPSNIAGAVIESLPAMGAGGVIGRGALAATRLGQMGSKGAVVAGALGEGAVMAGSQAEGIRQETDDGLLTPGQAGAALATGAIGAGLGYAGGKLANKLGVGNAETMLAQGTKGLAKQHADEAVAAAANPLMVQAAKGIPRQVIEGALVEGVFEELPQSVTETIIQNLALDKPWSEGLDEAIVLGVLSGGAMGAGAAGYKGFTAPKADENKTNEAKQAADKAKQEQEARKAEALQRVQQAWQQQAQLLAEQEAGEPEVPQTAPPDAAAMLAQQRAQEAQARQAEIDAGRAMASPDDEIYESTGTTMRPSEAMGLNPAAGGLEGAAALAVDTGASAAVQAAAQYIDPDDMPDAGADAPLSAASAVADTAPEDPFAGYERDYDELSDLEKELYDWEMTQREAPDEAFAALAELDDSDIPFFDRASNATDEDFLRALGASDEEIADALTTANQSASTQSHAASTAETQTNEPRGPRQSAGQGQDAEQVIQQQLLPTDPAARIAELEAIAKDADAQARDWASRTYKHNPKPLPEHEAKGGPADVGEANEQRRLKAIADAKQRAAEARAEITRLQEQGNTQAQLAAKAPSVADLAAISRKQIPDMTDAELVALASATSPEHGRFKKLQKALQSRGLQAQAATNKGATENGTQASQTQQAGTQQQQAGAAVGQAIDSVPAGAAAQAAGQSTVTATQKTGNDGAQAAAQGEAVAKAIAQEGNARREAERQRKLEASERWTRMTAAERQAAAANAKGLNAIQKKNVHTKPWADLSDKVRAALLDVVVPQDATQKIAPNSGQQTESKEKEAKNDEKAVTELIEAGFDEVADWAQQELAHQEPVKKNEIKKNSSLGKNRNGFPLFEDANGVRYYVESGIRIQETVSMRPTAQGMQMARGELKPDWMTEAEYAQHKAERDAKKAAAPKTTEISETATPDKTVGAQAKPAEYGANNKLVSKSRADELRAKLREKAKNHLFGGLDTEMLAWGTELAVFHIEAGVRKFADFAAAIANDLGTSPAKLRPYLRSWYNGARDMMEDHGVSVEGMDSPEQVRAELQKLATEPQTKETENAGTAVHGSGTAPLGAVAAGNDQGNARTGDAEPRSADGQQARSEAGGRPDGAGDAAARSGGNGTSAGNSVSARKSRRSVKKAKGAPKAATLQEQAAEEIKEASPVNIPGIDFTITDEVKLGQGTEAVKYADNIAAIRTLKQIEQEQRRATPEEQRILARYVGWGGLKNAFRVAGAREGEGVAKGWEKRVEELESLLTPAELRAARNSTTAAHYTSETVVKALWKGVQRLGFRGGAVLEPSVGTGNFLGLMPQELRGTSKTLAVEYDSLTARIAQHLYPNQTILHSGFQDVPLPDGKFALAIGNPPFGRESLFFRHNPALNGKSIHNQFFIQSLQSLQDDGIMGMVVSHNLMDAQDQASRLSMAISAEFVGAIRLPDTAFKENARTEVVTDILFFRKRSAVDLHHAAKALELMRSPVAKHDKILEGLSPNEVERAKEIYAEMQRWVPSSKQENFAGSGETISVNPYFLNNPQMVIGRMDASGTMNGRRELNVVLEDTSAFATMLDKAVQQLPERAPVDAVAQRTLAQFDQLATAMRLAVDRAEPGAVRSTLDGQLKVVLEMDDPEGNSRKTLLTEFDLNAETPWEEGYTLRSDGKWQREDDKLGEDGKPIKQLKKDGTPSNLNVKEITVYDDLAQIPEKHKWGAARIAVITDLLPLRDGLKRQLMLEASDAPEAMIEDNRKRLNDLYKAFKKKHGELHKSGTVKIAMTMPDGALALALEQLDKNGKAHPADILQRRVTVPPKPIDRVKSAGEAVAVVLAERGHIDLERVAQLLGTDEKGAMDALSEGDNPRAFYDPETGTWEPADAYLSGLVRRKLLAAKAAGLEKNVAALEKVQPEDWDATQITPNIGSAWIPGEVYADFLKHLGFSKASVHYSAATNTFTVAADGKPKAEWSGSDRALPTASIVERLMNSRPIKVQYKDSDGKPVVDEEATLESQMKAAEISNEFLDWAFADDDRREQLVQIFNEKYNTRVVRQRDGSHLTLPGKVPDSVIKMRPWQLNAVWRGITDNAVLYDHAVGAGKTFTAIARIMERRRMGLSKKPMVVVPNHLVEQWAADARKLYPGANILAATKHDFDKQRRRRLFARIGSGDYDMVIVGHSSFNFIDIDPSTEERYLDEELRIAYEAVQEAEAAAAEAGFSGWGKPMGVAEAERLVKKLEERMAKVRSAKRDRLLTFEEMGIDDLTVDEAHEFKNLAYSSKLQGVSGMGNKTGSAKAMDLNLKIRSLRERPGTSVAFLTGTPVSNSVAEMYLVLRNLAHQELKEMGMENFDAWRTQYVSASSAYEPTESGSLKEVTRLGREWMNMKSLMDLYYSVADAVTLQDMKDEFARVNPGKSFPVPKVRSQVNGEGDRAMVAVKPSKEQQTILRQIVSGFEGLQFIKNRKERGAERLRLMDRARKVSLDARAVDPSIHVEPGTGKIGAVVDNVFKTYQKWDEDKGTQIIFLDRSVPKSKGDDKILAAYDKLVNDLQKATNDGDEEEVANIEEKLEKYDANEMEELRNAQNGGWNAYEEIKRQLVAKGIPANEIRFVQEANNDAQKAALFKQVNSGEVRVLIGSTPRMGAGTNVQERLVALHHVDVTWKPSDIEQREGRIVRQGNHLLEKYGEDFTVDVIAYATEMTVDAKMWSLNATKLKAINGIRKYDGSFSMEFEDEESASMAEMAALATGNPLMVERVQLDGEIKKLEMAERSFTRRLNGVRGQLRQAERTIEQGPAHAQRLRAFAQQMENMLAGVRKRSDARRVTVNGQEFTSAAEAELAAMESVEKQQAESATGKGRYVVEINGEKATSRDRIQQLIRENLGDKDFEAEVDGQKYVDIGHAVRAIMDKHGPASSRGREFTLDGITINGMKVELDIAPSRWRPNTDSVMTMHILDGDGRPMVSRDYQYESVTLTGNSMRAGLQVLLKQFAPDLHLGDAAAQERQVERAKRDLPELQEQAKKTSPYAEELAKKRDRLQEVVAQLRVSSDSTRLSDAEQSAEAGEAPANFGHKSSARVGTPSDRAVMDMVREGRSAQDALKFIAGASRNPFNRKVARLLLRTGINPKLTMGEPMGGADGFTFLAKYNRPTDTVTMTDGAGYMAEQILLHELVHAATLKALDKRGVVSVQMRKLYEHVKRHGGAAGQYGMTNVSEFVAEAFTNPEFQRALKAMPAPAGNPLKSAWDAFVRVLKNILGLQHNDTSALAQALELGVEVMRENMRLRRGKNQAMANTSGVAGDYMSGRPASDTTEGPADGFVRLYHGGNAGLTEIEEGGPFNRFDGLFAGLGTESASSHGDGSMYFMDVPEEKILTQRALDYEIDHETTMAALRDAIPWLDDEDVDIAYQAVVEDQSHKVDDDDLMRVFGADSVGEASWEAQKYRGKLAKELGYQAVEMDDEHGTSYLVLPGIAVNPLSEQPSSDSPDDAFFGAADLRTIKSRGLELAHNALTHPGKVSLWDKTVGTMRHIAERYPAFKPVFDAAQQFLDDVASVANEAADMAPRLIPRVDTMRDMLKKPISVADNRAIGKALFSGTLDWGRDQHGKAMPMNELRAKYANLSVDTKSEILMASGKVQPQVIAMWRGKELAQYETLINNKFESAILKSGVRFSYEELRKFFNLNEQQISLYDEARATVDKSLDLTARAEMLRKLGRDWDFMRDMVMDAPTLTEAWKLLHEELEQRAKEIPDSRDQMAAKMFEIRASFDKAQELMEHGYMPLQRFGKYTVDVVDENGERVYFSMFESKAESNKMAQALRREYPNARVVQGTMNDQQFKLFAGITPETAELFGSMLGLDADGQDAKDQAFQEYLKLAKNNHSALKRLIHRKGIAGYSEDVGRVLASFVYSNARLAATGLNAGKMEQAINTLQTEHKEQGELGEIAAKLRSYIQDPQEEGHVIRGMLFAQYLGGSVASAAVNMTQPFAVTLPWLTQYGGMAAAGRYLAGALRDMAKRGHKYEADLAHALKMAEDDGVVSPQEIHQLMAQARGAGGLRTGDGTKLGDARAQAANLWEKVKVGWGQPFALAEQFNRRSTFIAAYRMAKDRKLGNPAEFARRAVLETQFLYSKANKPQWARGAVGGTLFTFKTYSVSFLELMHRMWTQGGPEGKRAVGWAMAMLLLMGGAGGLPFMEDLEDLIDGAGQMMGYNVSAKQWRQQLLRDVLGAELAGFIEQGMSGLPGAPVDVSGRLGMGNLIPGTGLLLDKQSNARDVVELLGPAGDLVQRGMQAVKSVASGVVNADPTSIGRGVMEVMPTAVRNAAKGVDMASSGIYKDTKGYKVIDTTLDEAVAKFLGFQPRSVAEVQEANSFMQRAKSFYIQTSNEIKAQWAKALFEKDAAGVERARQRVKEWNEKNPDQPIRVNMRAIWERVRQMGKDRTARIADTAPKALRQQLRDMAQEQSR